MYHKNEELEYFVQKRRFAVWEILTSVEVRFELPCLGLISVIEILKPLRYRLVSREKYSGQ